MLDQQDLQAIAQIVDEKIQASEARMTRRMDRTDQRVDNLETRMDKLEDRMDRMEVRMDNLEQDVRGIHVILENTVARQLQLLMEGQKVLLETLAPRAKTDALEEDVDLLKSVSRQHTHQIAELEKKVIA